ncbi:MAG: hypothetical protein BWY19_00226 [bacterium ADurb.Bin212]|nr:MAG: hypothetical protein BWY19_00226 [bacterium ADurb.Bin212]
MKNNKEIIKIEKEKKLEMINQIKAFFIDNRGEEIGDLQAELLLDFLIEKVGAGIYNQALNDALYWFKNRISDLEVDYYTLEKKENR